MNQHILPCLCAKVRGKSLEDFVSANQDRSRNALQKSLEAAYGAWVEQLKGDQTQFEAEQILILGSYLFKRFQSIL